MPTLKLTKTTIERIRAPDPSGRQVIHWDAELKGFGILASGTTTAKSYIAQRRLPDGRARRLTLGAVGEFARVEDARRKAGELLQGLRVGVDPKAERRRAAARDRTLRAWLELYLSSNKELRPRSQEEYRRGANRLEAWLDRPLREVTTELVEAKHAEIGRRSGMAAANGTMRGLRAVWNFALDRDGTMPANPTRVLKRKGWFPTPTRTRSVRAEELAHFFKAVDQLPNQVAADYLKLVLFTGLRRREASALKWTTEIDFGLRVIRLPAARMKAGRSLDLPMSSFVRDLLVARRALGNDNGCVFGADSRSGHIEEPKFALQQVADATGIKVSVHDLRRTFVTVAESTDISPMALKALVNHALGSDVTSGYVQMTAERLREPAERVAQHLMRLCGIEPPIGNVAAIR
jgi:integrase